MAGSAFYGYHVEVGVNGRARVVRNTAETMREPGNYYKTKTAAMKVATKHNKLRKRINPRIPRDKWIPASVRITRTGKIQAKLSSRRSRR